MTRRANPTVIGGFIIGAVILAVAGIAIFGSTSFFRQRPRAVAFFQGNVAGLSVGAPVTLRGVPVGTVTGVKIEIDEDKMISLIPVYMEFEPERLTITETKEAAAAMPGQVGLKRAIEHGLHARLASQSFVTGQLAVELSFDPNEPATLVGADPKTVEIPTAPSELEKLKGVLAQLPLDKIGASALRVLDDVDRLLTGPEVATLLQSMSAAGVGVNQLMTTANTDLKPFMDNLNDTLRSARETLNTAQGTLATGKQLMTSDFRDALRAATRALDGARLALSNANALLANSPQRYDLDQTLRNLSATSESLRAFAAELDRRPNALLIGK